LRPSLTMNPSSHRKLVQYFNILVRRLNSNIYISSVWIDCLFLFMQGPLSHKISGKLSRRYSSVFSVFTPIFTTHIFRKLSTLRRKCTSTPASSILHCSLAHLNYSPTLHRHTIPALHLPQCRTVGVSRRRPSHHLTPPSPPFAPPP
jgi:hypothetical protein